MNPTSEILERVNKSSSEHHDGVFTRLFRYLLREGAYVSDSLQLNVFKLLISAKAKLYANYFENSIVTLNFPKGKFI